MEKKGSSYNPHAFLEQLHKVYDSGVTPRRLDQTDFLPKKPMKTANLPMGEVLKRLAIEISEFQTGSETPTRGKNRLSYAYSLARKLQKQLDENPQNISVFNDRMTRLKEYSPELAEDITLVMQRTADKKRFQTKS